MTIAEKLIRAKTDLDEVYTAGYEKGKSEVIPSGDYSQGFAAGKQAEYDAFWDGYQDGGDRVHYAYGFAGLGWNNQTFKPKHNITPTQANNIFADSLISGNLVEILEELGVTVDLSQSTACNYVFSNTLFTRIGEANLSSCNAPVASFSYNRTLETIDKIVLKADGSQTLSNLFANTTSIKYITFEGTIGNNLSLAQSSLLEVSSMDSIYEHLKDYRSASGTYTLTLHANAWERWGDAKPDIVAQYGTMKNYVTATKGWGVS